MRLRTFVVLAAAFLILASGGVVWSQTVQGVITGTITDPTGAVVPNATVTITNTGTGLSQAVTTGSDGSYRFPLVPPGSYTVEIKAANFATVKISGIVVEASQTIPLNRQLELAKAQQTIEVTEQVPLVQTATSDLSTQIDRATIETAALPDRDVLAVLPFLASQATRGLDGNPTVGGTRESGTSYLLNGGDNNDNFSEGAVNIHPPLESVQDFSILTNDMSAEYGRGAGAVVTANQKSGSNRFHGVAYEQNRNDLLNANDFFTNREGLPRAKYIRNQFGGEIEGPIKKDKSFFSFAYDRIKLIAGAAAAQTFVPTSAGLNYVQLHGGPLAQAIIAKRPPVTSDATCPGTPFTGAGTDYWANGLPNPVGCLPFVDPKTDTEDAYYGRFDHNFSSKDRLSFAANVYRQNAVDKFGGAPLTTNGAVNATTLNHFHNLTLDETHSFSPRVLNEVTLAHNRHFNLSTEGNGTADTLPEIIIDNATGGCLGFQIGGDFEGGQVVGFVQDRWGISDNLTWTVGKHSFKFGGGTQYGILYRNWDLGLPGEYEFGELTTIDPTTKAVVTPSTDPSNGNTLQPNGSIAGLTDTTQANFSGDYPYFQEGSIDPRTAARGNAYRHYTYHDYNWFVQDNWKVTQRLTLNLGLRWERYGAPSEDHGILAQFTNFNSCNILNAACLSTLRVNPVDRMWPTQNHDFGPRVGFAWDPFGKGKMAIRGGYGILYDRIFDNIWSNGAWNPPFYALLDLDASGFDSVFYSNPASISTYNPNGPCGQIPYPPCATDPGGKRVSIRTMDVNMKDASSQNFYFGVEHQVFGGLLVRGFYQGAMGRHLPMLENINRVDGQAYNATLKSVRPNPLYTGFNYRSDSVSSNYHALVLEAQKRLSHGLQFQTGYTYSKLLDVNSELFAGCSTVGGQTAPYYYIKNSEPRRNYGRAAFDARHAYKFNVIYELPFLHSQKGIVGNALGGWTIASFFQFYSAHPIDLFNGRSRIRARAFTPLGGIEPNGSTCVVSPSNFTLPVSEGPGGTPIVGCRTTIKDQNGIPFNIGGDYNLDGVLNDHPIVAGPLTYSGKSPADGIFTNTTRIACSENGVPSFVNLEASSSQCVFGVTNPDGSVTAVAWNNPAFANPDYPGGATPFERFGNLGRDIFVGPRFIQWDMSVSKTFKITETVNLRFSAQAQNLANHASFDCVDSNIASGTFGRAQCLAQSGANGQTTTNVFVGGIGLPIARIMSVGLRLSF
jgi:hypothetical protein